MAAEPSAASVEDRVACSRHAIEDCRATPAPAWVPGGGGGRYHPGVTGTPTPSGFIALAAVAALAAWPIGCTGLSASEGEARIIDVASMSGADTPSVRPEDVVGPVRTVESRIETSVDGTRLEETVERIESPDGVDRIEVRVEERIGVGQPYPVEGLVGQINGRPVYADEFLLPLEDRIIRIFAELPLAQAVRETDRLLITRFNEYVDSELIIAEAESRLTAEQQQGIFAWLQNQQNETITNRGGTRDSASQSIEDEYGVSIEEFMANRRSLVLGQDLLRRRVMPRAIVSWRDVVQAYRRQFDEFNPPAVARLGRIRLHRERDAERLAAVEQAVEEGADFATILPLAGTADGGAWIDLEIGPGGIEETSLAATVKERLDLERPGAIGEPLDQGVFRTWFTVLAVDQPPGRSIYDPEVQLMLESELVATRFSQEQTRYIDSLRDRWVSGSIAGMLERLRAIARQRYQPR